MITFALQSQYSTLQQFNQTPKFFSESDGDYWEPASDTKGLYEQLSSKKYREILRNQIQYVTYNNNVHTSPLVNVTACNYFKHTVS